MTVKNTTVDNLRWEVKRTNLYEQVADELERAILETGLVSAGDDKLPSEQALGVKFGVSRTVIREALKLAKERGLIEQRTGEGSYITKPSPAAISSVGCKPLRSHTGHHRCFTIRQSRMGCLAGRSDSACRSRSASRG